MAAMDMLENKALEFAMKGDLDAAADIYEKIANLRLNVRMACKYIVCTFNAGRMNDSLRMVDKYARLLKGETKPQYTEFYILASVATNTVGLKEQSFAFSKKAYDSDPKDDLALFQRLSCEQDLGMKDNILPNKNRLYNFLENYAQSGDNMHAVTPFQVGSFFADSVLFSKVAKRSAQIHNDITDVIEHTATITHIMKPKIKIGYLCGHVRNHPTVHLLWDHLKHHNSTRFETHGFFYGFLDDYTGTKAFSTSLDNYTDITNMSDKQAAEFIKDSNVDVLVDISGLIEGTRPNIIARKPAPVIMNYMAYGATSGMNAVDYVITDMYTVPVSDAENYTEKLAYLPTFHMGINWQQPIDKAMQERVKWNLPDDVVVFGNMNQPYKWTPEVLASWMTILANVDNSVLWLLDPGYEVSRELVYIDAERLGIDKDRIIFAPFTDKETHMSRLSLMDVYLDSSTVCGHTTTLDAIHEGVFPLVMEGTHFYSRVSSSIMKHIGCGEMVAQSLEEYTKIAIMLGRDKMLTEKWRNYTRLQARENGLFDMKSMVSHLENAYETAYVRWASGLAPEHFVAEPVIHNQMELVGDLDVSINTQLQERIARYPVS